MKILVDLNHPAHYHYSKNLIKTIKQKGVKVLITARDRYPLLQLLEADNMEYINRGKGAKKLLGKMLYFVKADYILLRKAIKFKPDVFLAFMSPYAPQISRLTGKKSILFDDTEHAHLHKKTTYPFCDTIVSPSCFMGNLGEKHIKFNGYLELAYLHPDYFTPDAKVLEEIGIKKNDKYVVMRFVSWQAHHDVGHQGISLKNKIKAVKEFSRFAKVFISAEEKLPAALEPYRIKLSPEKMHHVLAYASLLFGESATMATEAAILGTPAIYIDNDGRGYTKELEKEYGLVFNFSESLSHQTAAIKKGIELLQIQSDKKFKLARDKILKNKIDVTAFMLWFLNNYPESFNQIKNHPQKQFPNH